MVKALMQCSMHRLRRLQEHPAGFLLLFLLLLLAASTRAWAEPAPGGQWTEPATGMVFAWVPGGCFTMGCDGADCPADSRPARKVCLDGFWMSRWETTQEQWERVMGGKPSAFKGAGLPVENVSWRDADAFAEALGAATDSGDNFVLPTEAQWEYACEAGREAADPGAFTRRTATAPAGRGEPNGYGLWDMAGNVREWVRDTYAPDAYGLLNASNPVLEREEGDKVARGDCWMKEPQRARCALRLALSPGIISSTVGFRLVRLPDPDAPTPLQEVQQPQQPRPQPEALETQALSLRSVDLETRNKSVVVVLRADRPIEQYDMFTLEEPARVVLDLPGSWRLDAPTDKALNFGRLRRARAALHEGKLRVVLDIDAESVTGASAAIAGGALELRIPQKQLEASGDRGKNANVLQEVRFDPSIDGLNVVLLTAQPVASFESSLGSEGKQLVVRLPGRWSMRPDVKDPGASPPVVRVRTRAEKDGLVMEADLSEPMRGDPVLIGTRQGLVVSLPAEAFPGLAMPASAAGEKSEPLKTRAEPTPSNVLQGVGIDRKGRDLLLKLEAESPVRDYELRTAQGGSVLEVLAPGLWKSLVPEDRKIDSGPVRMVSVSVRENRLSAVFHLAEPAVSKPSAKATAEGLELRLLVDAPAGSAGQSAKKSQTPSASPAPSAKLAERDLPAINAPSESVAETFKGLSTQLYFSCSMASASYQTLVWDQNGAPPKDLPQAMAPYKNMFRSMALEKGGDNRTWELINSPVFDECVFMLSQGADPAMCEAIKQLNETQLAQVYAAAAVAENPRDTIRSIIRSFLEPQKQG
ncbi:MAG: hypothetical protein PWQ57_1, partial [Desulfovibrionales bacterium]|nr:hypothetical protein [Desulfovibrionales bacterium]